jgi:hypothetical protein
MNIRLERTHASSGGFIPAVFSVLRIVLGAVIGLVVMLSALALGVVVGASVLVWKLLGGRKPVARFGWRTARRGAPTQRATAARGDVIDIEAREVVTTSKD